MKKFVGMFLFAGLILGCSGGTPSRSDVEDALKAEIAACPNLAIENVKLINGLKLDEMTHKVEAEYDLRVIPLPAEVIRENKASRDEYGEAVRKHLEEVKEMEAHRLALIHERVRLDDKVNAELAGNPNSSREEWSVNKAALDEKYGITEMKAQEDILEKEIAEFKRTQFPKSENVKEQVKWGSEACIFKSGVDWIGRPAVWAEAVKNGAVNSFHVTFVMVKTDNGWMKAQ